MWQVRVKDAIRHLVEMAEVATDRLRLRPTEIGWPLDQMWVAGAWLQPADEIDHGTVILIQAAVGSRLSRAGNFRRQQHSAWSGLEVGMQWKFSGVWVLNGKFEVKSAPRSEFSPPGFYPSPHEVGRWELWTGVAWSGSYQDGPLAHQARPMAVPRDTGPSAYRSGSPNGRSVTGSTVVAWMDLRPR